MKFLLVNTTKFYKFRGLGKKTKKAKLKSLHTPPLGLLYIGQSLEDEGHTVEVIELCGEEHPEEQIKKSLNSADAVGLSVTSYPYETAAQLAKTIKEIDASIPIIIGGPHCSYHPKKSLLDIPDADIGVAGDGEQAIKDVVKALQEGKKLSEVAGVHYRIDNKINAGKPPIPIDDLDSISFPARHLVDKYDYGRIGKSYLFKPKVTSMVTSRGCPFNCRFCSRNTLGFKTYRARSAENVVKEIQDIDEKYGSVIIADDNFLADKKRASMIMDKLIEAGTDIDIYVTGARVDSADRDLYLKMKKAGVVYLEFGVESGNQDALDFYNKKITLDQIRKAVRLSYEMGFFTAGNFIVGAPVETKRHIEQTIEFACSLPFDLVLFAPLYYQYGSDLWNEGVENGKINENDGYVVAADVRRGLGNFSIEELNAFCSEALTRFYMRPPYILREVFKAIRSRNFRFIRTRLETL